MGVFQLGINGLFHDSSACLLEDGVPRLAVEEERLSRVKHTARFPERAVARCLEEAGITLDDVSDVAFSWHAGRFLRNQIRLGVANLPASLHLLAPGASEVPFVEKLSVLVRMRAHLKRRFAAPRAPFRMHYVRHHVAHAYDAFVSSPFERAAVLVIDGFGEGASTSIFSIDERRLEHHVSIPYPHSLGMLYATVTELLGFKSIHDEYKVMGLSAYGSDRYRDAFDRVLQVGADGGYRLDLSYVTYHTHGRNQLVSPRLAALLGPVRREGEPLTDRHRDVACSLQRAIERAVLALAERARRLTGLPDLCLVGGVAQNVCANALVVERGPFARVHVPPAPSDAGTALGAIQAVRATHAGWRPPPTTTAFLGPRFSREASVAALVSAGLAFTEIGASPSRIVDELVAGRLVGVFHGRMELGARALGNRSILADPRRVAVRDHLNATIKRREEFRPFAPAVPEERAHEFFRWDAASPIVSPYMSYVARVRDDRRDVIPAVVHVDGTARVQTVRRDENPFFWRLLIEFGEATGVPVLLNTSFNENEPIVCSPTEAIACYLRTPLDALCLDGLLVRKLDARPAGDEARS